MMKWQANGTWKVLLKSSFPVEINGNVEKYVESFKGVHREMD